MRCAHRRSIRELVDVDYRRQIRRASIKAKGKPLEELEAEVAKQLKEALKAR